MPRPIIIERVYTRDARIPRVAYDYEFVHGWRCIPLPPSLDEGWTIFDTSRDHKTGWQRIRYCKDDDRPEKYEQIEFDFLDR